MFCCSQHCMQGNEVINNTSDLFVSYFDFFSAKLLNFSGMIIIEIQQCVSD